jgi:hypothetical protein
VAPLRLGGLRGKKSTPSDWLGGTGVGLYGRRAGVGGAREWHEARDVIEAGVKATICSCI